MFHRPKCEERVTTVALPARSLGLCMSPTVLLNLWNSCWTEQNVMKSNTSHSHISLQRRRHVNWRPYPTGLQRVIFFKQMVYCHFLNLSVPPPHNVGSDLYAAYRFRCGALLGDVGACVTMVAAAAARYRTSSRLG